MEAKQKPCRPSVKALEPSTRHKTLAAIERNGLESFAQATGLGVACIGRAVLGCAVLPGVRAAIETAVAS